jgi:hypothetical protein
MVDDAKKYTEIGDGISRAYNFKNPKEEKPAKKSSRPEIEKYTPPKPSDGKDIFEVIWNDFIVYYYAWLIGHATDLLLEFLNYALYPEKKAKKAKKDKVGNGRKVLEEWQNNIDKQAKNLKDRHAELMDNARTVSEGGTAEWKISKAAPTNFDEIVQLIKDVRDHPTVENKAKLERLEKFPEFVEKIKNREKNVASFSIVLATYKVLQSKYNVPLNARKDVDNLEKAFENRTDPVSAASKTKINGLCDQVLGALDPSNAQHNIVREKIEELRGLADKKDKDSEKKIKENFKAIKSGTKRKDYDDSKEEEAIKFNATKYRDQLNANIAKIEENCGDDAEKVLDEYMSSLKSEAEKMVHKPYVMLKVPKFMLKFPHVERIMDITKAPEDAINSFKLPDGRSLGYVDKVEREHNPLDKKNIQGFHQQYIQKVLGSGRS